MTAVYAFGSRALDDIDSGGSYLVYKCKAPSAPVELLEHSLGRYEGSHVSDWRYGEGMAELGIAVFGDDAVATELARDTLLRDLYRGQQQLKLGLADERYWLARLAGAPVIEKRNDGLHMIEARFRPESAFAYATAPGVLTVGPSALTSLGGGEYVLELAPTVGGNIYARPLITITFPAAGGSPFGVTSLWVKNNSFSPAPALYVDRTYAASNILTIDCSTFAVEVNGSPVDFAGQFITLDPREGTTNDIEVHVLASSTPTLTAKLDWTPRWSA